MLALRTGTGQELPLREEPALAEIYGEFTRIEKAEREAASSISLLALANRVPMRAALVEPKIVEVEKSIADVKIISEPEKVEPEPQFPEPKMSVTLEPEKSPIKTEAPKPIEKTDVRREVVMPEENREFPL